MLVVADSSPLIVLAKISHIDLLPKLFGTIFIPPAISKELSAPTRPKVVRDLIVYRPAWPHEFLDQHLTLFLSQKKTD